MRRTLSIQIYDNGYVNLLDQGASVRLCYAVKVGNNLTQGGLVPGVGFEYMGNGIWERDIDTDIINANRTDYYYLQYTKDSGTIWEDVAGYDPFYFNTKISYLQDQLSMQPYIGNKSPDDLGMTEGAISIDISFPGTFVGGDPVNSTYIREFYYAFSSSSTPPTTDSSYIKRTTMDDSITVNRYEATSVKDNYIHAKLRILNPITNEVSAYGEVLSKLLESKSISQILNMSALPTVSGMSDTDLKEVSLLGIDDAITVQMPPLESRGQHAELAIQYGGTPFTISEGGELDGFAGTIIPCYTSSITIPKPLFYNGETSVYMARRVVGYNESTAWVGYSTTTAYKKSLNNPAKISILSDNIVEALVNAVIAKTETSTGETIARKA